MLPTLESLQRSPFGYRGVNFSRRRTFTTLISATRRRTSAGILAGMLFSGRAAEGKQAPEFASEREFCNRLSNLKFQI